MRPIDADACPALFGAEFQKTKRLILDGEKHLDNLAEGFMEANNVIRTMPTITPPPNDPLTLEELREMDGKPIWVVNSSTKKGEGFSDEWALVSVRRKTAESVGTIYHFENYGDYWLAYRRKPEGPV